MLCTSSAHAPRALLTTSSARAPLAVSFACLGKGPLSAADPLGNLDPPTVRRGALRAVRRCASDHRDRSSNVATRLRLSATLGRSLAGARQTVSVLAWGMSACQQAAVVR